VNIFAGINRCDWVAQGVVQAARDLQMKVPLVVRLAGTNVQEGQRIIRESGLPIITADSLSDAADRVVTPPDQRTGHGNAVQRRTGEHPVGAQRGPVEPGLLDGCVGRERGQTDRARPRAAEADRSDSTRRVLATPAFNWAVFRLWTEGPDAADLLRACRSDVVLRGDESSAPMVLAQLALAEYLRGAWPEAATVAEEAHELALQTGQLPMQAYALSIRALVRASLGLEAEARADADQALALAGERGMAAARAHSRWALGLLELSLDRPSEAVRLLAPERARLVAGGVGEPGALRFIADEIEALVTLGSLDDAEVPVAWLDERARALDRAWARGAALRSRGLIQAARGERQKALASFEAALVEHTRVAIPFERARTLLHLGAAQRRSKRKSKARETLGEALAIFEELGADLWSRRARAELGSVGGRAASGDELTPAEARVAALVAEGLTNREVAAALFVSDHTVEFHLTRVYRKLGVRSRAELARRLPG